MEERGGGVIGWLCVVSGVSCVCVFLVNQLVVLLTSSQCNHASTMSGCVESL